MQRIIGLAGKMRSGKGLLANWLNEEYGYSYFEVADAIKNICVDILDLDNREQLDILKNNYRKIGMHFTESLCERFAKECNISAEFFKKKMLGKDIQTVRELLQVIGTDVLRAYDPNWHINRLMDEVMPVVKDGGGAVIADVRFPNEKLAIEGIGGKVYYVKPYAEADKSEHISENSLSESDFNEMYIINNDLDEKALIKEFEKKMR